MEWEVEYTDEFEAWWTELDPDEQESITASVGLLERLGPHVPYPHSSDIKTSRHGRMRMAILLIGGEKTGDSRFYEIMVPVADRLYDEHLAALRREGLLHDKEVC